MLESNLNPYHRVRTSAWSGAFPLSHRTENAVRNSEWSGEPSIALERDSGRRRFAALSVGGYDSAGWDFGASAGALLPAVRTSDGNGPGSLLYRTRVEST